MISSGSKPCPKVFSGSPCRNIQESIESRAQNQMIIQRGAKVNNGSQQADSQDRMDVTNTLLPMAVLDDIVAIIVFFTVNSVVASSISGGSVPLYMIPVAAAIVPWRMPTRSGREAKVAQAIPVKTRETPEWGSRVRPRYFCTVSGIFIALAPRGLCACAHSLPRPPPLHSASFPPHCICLVRDSYQICFTRSCSSAALALFQWLISPTK